MEGVGEGDGAAVPVPVPAPVEGNSDYQMLHPSLARLRSRIFNIVTFCTFDIRHRNLQRGPLCPISKLLYREYHHWHLT